MEDAAAKPGVAELMQEFIENERLIFDASDVDYIIIPAESA